MTLLTFPPLQLLLIVIMLLFSVWTVSFLCLFSIENYSGFLVGFVVSISIGKRLDNTAKFYPIISCIIYHSIALPDGFR